MAFCNIIKIIVFSRNKTLPLVEFFFRIDFIMEMIVQPAPGLTGNSTESIQMFLFNDDAL